MDDLLRQLREAWGALETRQKVSLVLSAVLTIVAVGGIVWWAQQPSWGVLYTGLDPKDAQAVIEELQSQRVPVRVRDGGRVIEVPVERVDRLRMDLAAKNLPASGRFGFLEMFAQDNIAQSSRVQKIRYQKALEDELARTIESLEEVSRARVHLALPGDRVFLDDDDTAKASVTITLRAGTRLASDQVQGIARIVAGAVPELTPEHVSVVDSSGKVLWEGSGDEGDMLATRQLEMKTAIERDIDRKVAKVLAPLVGEGHFVVRTNADLDFQKVSRHERQYDPDSGVLVSEEKSKEKTRSAAGGGGVPGTASNLPGGVGAAGMAGESSERTDQVSNFEYSVVEKRVEEPVGRIRRLSVAVLVDHKPGETGGEGEQGNGTAKPERVPRSAEEMARIEQLVKAAISFDPDRGDVVTVEQAPFPPVSEHAPPAGFDLRQYLPWMKWPALVLLLLLAFFLFWRPFLKTVREAAERVQARAAAATAEVEAVPQLGPPSRLERMRQQLAKLALEEPEGMAQTVRVWLNETKG